MSRWISVFALLATTGSAAHPEPVTNISLYEFTSYWQEVAFASVAGSRPLQEGDFSCLSRLVSCFPRHCDTCATLTVDRRGVDSLGNTSTSHARAECGASNNDADRTMHDTDDTYMTTADLGSTRPFKVVQLGPLAAKFPEGFYAWAIVQEPRFDALGPVDALTVFVRDPAEYEAYEKDVTSWLVASGYSQIVPTGSRANC